MALGGTLVTVATSATQLSTTTQNCVEVSVRALAANSANIFFGGSNITTSANYRVFLAPGESYTWGPYSPGSTVDLNEIYYISANSADKFSLSYNKR